LPYGADYFIENVVDGAHVTISHHNIVGSRHGDQRLKLSEKAPLTESGFAVEAEIAAAKYPAVTTFQAPSTVSIETTIDSDGSTQNLELYCSPSTPGFCNHIGRQVIIKPRDGKMPPLLKQFTLPLPKWMLHLMSSAFLNQDALFLHHQERYLAKTGLNSSLLRDDKAPPLHYSKAVLPVNSDFGVINFRNWMRQLAGGRIPYKFNPSMPEASNEIVFDVWNGHTKYCKYCRTALTRLKKARFAFFSIATVLGVLRPSNRFSNLVGVFLSAGIGLLLNKLIGMFYRYEFSHPHND